MASEIIRNRTPEEQELEKKKAELASLEAELTRLFDDYIRDVAGRVLGKVVYVRPWEKPNDLLNKWKDQWVLEVAGFMTKELLTRVVEILVVRRAPLFLKVLILKILHNLKKPSNRNWAATAISSEDGRCHFVC